MMIYNTNLETPLADTDYIPRKSHAKCLKLYRYVLLFSPFCLLSKFSVKQSMDKTRNIWVRRVLQSYRNDGFKDNLSIVH